MIEAYYCKEKGYHPFLIRDGWQVAQLNYVEKHGLDDIDQIEVHNQTDEVFILLEQEDIHFNCQYMKPGVTYNIPAGTWHEIAMKVDAEIIIVERSDTHKQDCSYLKLTVSQQQELYSRIKQQLA